MKKILILAFVILACNAFGQTEIGTKSQQKAEQLEYLPNAAIFVNGKLVNDDFLATTQPDQILSFSVKNEPYKADSKVYNGQVHLIYKDNKEPLIMSLNEALEKYTKLDSKPVIFMLDGEIVKEDYDTVIIEEENLLQFNVDEIVNEKEDINLYVVKILTRTEENIEKLNRMNRRKLEENIQQNKQNTDKEFWIRGTETSMNPKP